MTPLPGDSYFITNFFLINSLRFELTNWSQSYEIN